MVLLDTVKFIVTKGALYVANTGRPIERIGVISICRQFLSSKGATPPVDDFVCSDEALVDEIRTARLNIYRDDRNELTEDASQEESTSKDYLGRSIWELLQNADDAMAPEGSPSSELIGAKGLGFKSVLEITERPEIYSGRFEFRFDPDESQRLLKEITVSPPRLIFRLPHTALADELTQRLRAKGFTTVIKLPYLDSEAHNSIASTLNKLEPYFLLLSQHLRTVEIVSQGRGRRVLSRSATTRSDANNARVVLKTQTSAERISEEWRVWSRTWPAPSETFKRLSATIAVPFDREAARQIAEDMPLYVFFPTEEEIKTPFLVHAAFELRGDRNHLRQKGAHEEILLAGLDELTRTVARSIPPSSVIHLFAKLAKQTPGPTSQKPEKRIQRMLALAVKDCPFVPTCTGKRVRPREIKTWEHEIGSVVDPESVEIIKANLAAVDLRHDFNILFDAFGSEYLRQSDYALLLKHTNCNDVASCLRAANTALLACLERRFVPDAVIDALAQARFWPTSGGRIRELATEPPLLTKKPTEWPEWLIADELDPTFYAELFEGDASKTKAWENLLVGRLHRTEQDWILYCLAPILSRWSEQDWTENGWHALRIIEHWRPKVDWSELEPFAPGSEKTDPCRSAVVRVTRVPSRKQWVPAVDSYAGPAIGGDRGLARFFRSKSKDSSADRFLVDKQGATAHFGQSEWKALLRYVGVSWEPKLRSLKWRIVGGKQDGRLCDRGFNREVKESRLNYLDRDWYLDYFPNCIADTKAKNIIKILRTLIPVVSKLRAGYFKRNDSRETYPPRPFSSYADYQLRCEKYLPCQPSISHRERRCAPSAAYWPDHGLRGITPVVDLSGVPERDRPSLRRLLVNDLKVRDRLPSDWPTWLDWFESLADAVARNEGSVKERVARDFYERFIEQKIEDLDDPDDPVLYEELHLVCQTSLGLSAAVATEAVWIDDPPLATPEAYNAFLSAGLPLFLPLLKRGNGCVERLGVKPASEVVQMVPRFDHLDERRSAEHLARLRSRGKALAAICETKREQWKPPRPIRGVWGLRVALFYEQEEISERPVSTFSTPEGWLVSLDGDEWDALAAACANPYRNSVDLKHRFAAVLRAKRKDISHILLEDGIPTYRLKEIGLADDDAHEVSSQVETDDDLLEDDEVPSEPGAGQPLNEGETEKESSGAEGKREGFQAQTSRGERTLSSRSLFSSAGTASGRSSQGKARSGSSTSARKEHERGLRAEAWLSERLRSTLPDGWEIQTNYRDDEGRESDFVIQGGGTQWHIEAKSLTSERLYWSDLERSKAEDHPNRYLMALLVGEPPNLTLYWSWNPLNDFKGCERRVQWVWAAEVDGPPLQEGSWQLPSAIRPPDRAPDRLNHMVRVLEQDLTRLDRDDAELKVFWNRIMATINRKTASGS